MAEKQILSLPQGHSAQKILQYDKHRFCTACSSLNILHDKSTWISYLWQLFYPHCFTAPLVAKILTIQKIPHYSITIGPSLLMNKFINKNILPERPADEITCQCNIRAKGATILFCALTSSWMDCLLARKSHVLCCIGESNSRNGSRHTSEEMECSGQLFALNLI